jgi:hypothetical protein
MVYAICPFYNDMDDNINDVWELDDEKKAHIQ